MVGLMQHFLVVHVKLLRVHMSVLSFAICEIHVPISTSTVDIFFRQYCQNHTTEKMLFGPEVTLKSCEFTAFVVVLLQQCHSDETTTTD